MPKKYEFYHGRVWLVWLYGILFAIILPAIFIPFSNLIFDTLSERSYRIFILILILSPFIFVSLFPPERLKINVKCVGILHDDRVEIHQGTMIKTQRYEDIEHVKKVYSFIGFRITIWYIGEFRIHKAVGIRNRHKDSESHLDSFMNDVEFKVQTLQKD